MKLLLLLLLLLLHLLQLLGPRALTVLYVKLLFVMTTCCDRSVDTHAPCTTAWLLEHATPDSSNCSGGSRGSSSQQQPAKV